MNIINEEHRDKISREIYLRRKAEVGDAAATLNAEDSDDEDLIGYDAIEPGLPPASSDQQKWWLDNGKMARSVVAPPKPSNGMHSTILNPNRPPNPWTPSEEPDWVTVPRSESRLSSFSSMSSSPYEHITPSSLLSTSASSTAPRKLPPPYDPAALPSRVGRLALANEQEQTAPARQDTPPAPPPRRQTGGSSKTRILPPPLTSQPVATIARSATPKTAPAPPPPRPSSSASQKTGKAPPPVARKPAHLALSPSNSPRQPSEQFSDSESRPQPPRRPSTSIQGSGNRPFIDDLHRSLSTRDAARDDTPPPKPPRRAGTEALSTAGGRSWAPPGAVGLVGLSKDDRPVLPARKPVSQRPTPPPNKMPNGRAQTVDLLGDDTMEMGGWEALKPT